RIVSRCKEGESLDMVPVEVRKGNEHCPYLLVATCDQVLAQVPNAAARIQDRHLAEVARQHYTGRVAPEVLKVSVTNRDRTSGAIELSPGWHACSSSCPLRPPAELLSRRHCMKWPAGS